MKLSLSILAEWLKEYQPVINIKDGNREIQNVRVLVDNIVISPSTVYLEQIGQHHILCSNGKDYMTLICESMREVLNSILDAFAFYNDWEEKIMRQIRNKCKLIDMLKFGYEMLHRFLALADATFLVYQTYGENIHLKNHPDFEQAVNNRMLPLNVLLDINKEKHIRIPSINSYDVSVPSMNANTIVSNLFSFSRHNGWLITFDNKGVYKKADYDLQDAFAELLQIWMEHNEYDNQKQDRVSIFRDLVEGETVSEKAKERLEVFHWHFYDPKQIYVLSPKTKSTDSRFVLIRQLDNVNPNAFTFTKGNLVVYIVNHTLISTSEHRTLLKDILSACDYVAGESAVFYELEEVYSHYNAAVTAAEYALRTQSTILQFQQVLLQYIRNLIRDNSCISLKHPDIEILCKYDEEHQTQLSDTLYVLLKNNCSLTAAAKELYIHRSTLLYRIERIKEMTDVNLDDYECRLQLQVFFYLNENE